MRLIDADALIGELHTQFFYDGRDRTRMYAKVQEQPTIAQPERILYANMSDAEFEKWLYEHGICHPNIHESIPCDAVPLLIDDAISELPSAQPEQLTDKEQRIFLSAMAREEKVCKEVDEECRNTREPYEDSLVKICHEITRKVKGALWNGE